MNLRTLAVASAVVFSLGCQRTAQAAPPAAPAAVPSAPAPFTSPPDIASLVAKVSPAVVNITAVHEVKRGEMDSPFLFDPFGMFGRRGPVDAGPRKALGTGFIIDSAGHVVTNSHVVEKADEVKVKLLDEREFQARVKGRDVRLDLAILELVGAKDLPYVSLGSSAEMRVGDSVIAIGNPLALGHTVTHGIVSAKSRAIGAGPYDDFIQTDASINPGNSGGPLFNARGQVIGINTVMANPSRALGIGFAIPIDALKNVLPQLLTTGRVARGRLGVVIQEVDAALAAALGIDRPRGALVAQVEPGGPAEKAGLKAGDVILKVDKSPILHEQELPRTVASHTPGTKVRLEVWRDKASRTMDATLDTLKDDEDKAETESSSAGPTGRAPAGLGLGLADAPGRGVIVERVAPDSPADGVLRPGDLVVEISGRPVQNAADAARAIAAVPQGRAVLLKLTRGGHPLFVAITKR